MVCDGNADFNGVPPTLVIQLQLPPMVKHLTFADMVAIAVYTA